jgi:phosphinothricin acetyltransferase
MQIRPAEPADAGRVATIYNEGILEGATFETRLRDGDDVIAWLQGDLPVVVAVVGGEVVGFAKVGSYSERDVYRGVGEHAVYVTRAARGQGVGRALLEALADAAERTGLYKLTSRILPTNAASLAVHRAAGFEVVGIQRRHGKVDGVWHDCVLVERLLGEAAD